MEMNQILRNSPITFVFCEVEGYDNDLADFVYKDAPQPVQRNIDMDAQAKSLLKTIKSSPQPKDAHAFPAQKITLLLSDLPIVGDINIKSSNIDTVTDLNKRSKHHSLMSPIFST